MNMAAIVISRSGRGLRRSIARTWETIRNISIGAGPGGNGVLQIPLAEVTSVEQVSGASFVYREQQERYIPIKFSVRGRDLGSTVLECSTK